MLLAVLGALGGLTLAAALWAAGGSSGSGIAPSVTSLPLGEVLTPGSLPPDSSAGARSLAAAAPGTEPANAAEALATFLEALRVGDDRSAYALVDAASRADHPTLAAFSRSLADRAIPLAFDIGNSSSLGSGGTAIAVSATHEPGIDPFRGLVPGRSESVWTVSQQDGLWRVASEPTQFRAVLPPDSAAREAVQSWLSLLARCDRPGAASLQAFPDLYGPADLPGLPCARGGAWTAGDAGTIEIVPDPSALLAAFGAQVSTWARVVPVRGTGASFLAAVAPMGESWRVIATATE